jgi:hypothetical protein
MRQTKADIAATRAFTPPRTFFILINSAGCVRGSAYPSAADDLAENMPASWRIEQVSSEEWDRRAKPCLSGECDHAGGAR